MTDVNSSGATKLAVSKCADWFRKTYRFLSIEDTNELIYYDETEGRWTQHGELVIKEVMESSLGPLASVHNVSEVVEHVRRTKYIKWAELAEDGHLINLRSGVWDMESGVLVPHSPEYHFTWCCPVEYDKNGDCPKIRKFLADITGGDGDLQENILEGIAWCFLPGMPIQKAIMLVGPGANGKSTLLGLITAFLGPENVSHATIQQLSSGRFSVAWLRGKLANVAADLPSTGIRDAGMFKALTGGDTVYAELKGVQAPLPLRSRAKMWFSANVIPIVEEDTDAFFRRWNIMELRQTFSEGRDLLPELTAAEELSGLFNLILPHLAKIRRTLKFTHSKDVQTERNKYVRNSDSVKVFGEEVLVFDSESGPVEKAVLYDAYVQYCTASKLICVSDRVFWRRAKELWSFDERRPSSSARRVVYGISISSSDTSNKSNIFPNSGLLLKNNKRLENNMDLVEQPVQPEQQAKLGQDQQGELPLAAAGRSGYCPECGTVTDRLYTYAGRYMCGACLEKVKNPRDDNEVL